MNAYLRLMRFDKPIGIFLLAWPMLWALWLAAGGLPPLWVLAVFAMGAVCLRAAGCIINDIADRKVDGHVERTKQRPLVTGEASLKGAMALFVGLLLLAFVLVCTLNSVTIKLALVAPLLASLYPFTKRFTYWPQLFLGIAFAWAIPMAFAAVQCVVPLKAWCLYALALLWPMMYDTQYAMVDRDDDMKIGVKSTAIRFGAADRYWLLGMQTFLLLLLWAVGYLFRLNGWFWCGTLLVLADFAYQQALTWRRERRACFKAFLHNNWLGALIFLLVVVGLNAKV